MFLLVGKNDSIVYVSDATKITSQDIRNWQIKRLHIIDFIDPENPALWTKQGLKPVFKL